MEDGISIRRFLLYLGLDMDLRQMRCELAVDTRVILIWEALSALRLVSSTTLRKVWYSFDLEKNSSDGRFA